MKKLLTILLSIFLFSSICYAEEKTTTWEDILGKGLFRLIFDTHKEGFQIKGQVYTIGDDNSCEGDFTFTQFMEPNLLIYTFLPPRRTCHQWRTQLIGSKIAIMREKKLFEKLRSDGRDHVGETMWQHGLCCPSDNPRKVEGIKVIKIELLNGSVMPIPIVKPTM